MYANLAATAASLAATAAARHAVAAEAVAAAEAEVAATLAAAQTGLGRPSIYGAALASLREANRRNDATYVYAVRAARYALAAGLLAGGFRP